MVITKNNNNGCWIIEDGYLKLVDTDNFRTVRVSIKETMYTNDDNVIIKSTSDYVVVSVMTRMGLIFHTYKNMENGGLIKISTIETPVRYTSQMWNIWSMEGNNIRYIHNRRIVYMSVHGRVNTTKHMCLDGRVQLVRYSLNGDTKLRYLVRTHKCELKICGLNNKVYKHIPNELSMLVKPANNLYVDSSGEQLYIIVMDNSSMYNIKPDIVIDKNRHYITRQSNNGKYIILSKNKIMRK